MDWDMPEIDGIRTAEKIRAIMPETAPIFLFTSHDIEGMDEVHSEENIGILAKPFFVSALKERIMELQEKNGEKGRTEAETDNSLEGLRFLAAEDNEINAEILEEILEMEGAAFEVVENGKMALERFKEAAPGEFDAILMDVQMPVMNGYEATKAIRALEREDAGKIPIIAMTANAFAEDEKEALEAGMNVHVAKPIDIELLKKVIRQCVRN